MLDVFVGLVVSMFLALSYVVTTVPVQLPQVKTCPVIALAVKQGIKF